MAWTRYGQTRKYGNKKVTVDDMEFDSKKEARVWQELKLREWAGEIRDLRRQVKFVLIPAQREESTTGKRGGVKLGKIIERECAYIADFVYRDVETDKTEVVDVKGCKVGKAYDVFTIKRKLMLERYGIRVKEV